MNLKKPKWSSTGKYHGILKIFIKMRCDGFEKTLANMHATDKSEKTIALAWVLEHLGALNLIKTMVS